MFNICILIFIFKKKRIERKHKKEQRLPGFEMYINLYGKTKVTIVEWFLFGLFGFQMDL